MSFGQGRPQWGPGGSGSQPLQWGGQTPDWAALAEASESRNRRRRWLMVGGGTLATVAIGAAVAMAVVSADGENGQAANRRASDLPATSDLPPDSTGPEPSFAETSAPPPLDPKDFISSKQKDTAPLSPDILFPGSQLTMGESRYEKGKTASTKDCASAAQSTLGTVLTKNDCTRLMRVTYSLDGVAVTAGVAVFDTEVQAAKAKNDADDNSVVQSLSGDGVPEFCRSAVCRSTTNSYGRYAYFTVAGFTNGKDVTQKDTKVFSKGDDLAEFTFRQIRRRAEAQAAAAANE